MTLGGPTVNTGLIHLPEPVEEEEEIEMVKEVPQETLPYVLQHYGAFLVAMEYTLGQWLQPNARAVHKANYGQIDVTSLRRVFNKTVTCYRNILSLILLQGLGVKLPCLSVQRLLETIENAEDVMKQQLCMPMEIVSVDHRRNPMRRFQLTINKGIDALMSMDKAVTHSVNRIGFLMTQMDGNSTKTKEKRSSVAHSSYWDHEDQVLQGPSKRLLLESPGNQAAYAGPRRLFPMFPRTSGILELLQKKRKRMSDGLYKYVLWKEALKGEKQRLAASMNTNRLWKKYVSEKVGYGQISARAITFDE